MLLELRDIYAGYNGSEILMGTTAGIYSGEIVALIGANGVGKSTILRVISGLILPKSGRIIFNDVDITFSETRRRMSMGMGYFLQGGEVFKEMIVAENLQMGGMHLETSVFKERLDALLKLFPKLKDKLRKRAGTLSGGEAQMLALCMVLLNRPKLLLLDEPSAGLAPGLASELMEKIVEINKIYDITIILVEQRQREAKNIAHRCYEMTYGKLVLKEAA